MVEGKLGEGEEVYLDFGIVNGEMLTWWETFEVLRLPFILTNMSKLGPNIFKLL